MDKAEVQGNEEGVSSVTVSVPSLKPLPLPKRDSREFRVHAVVNGPALARILLLMGVHEANHPAVCGEVERFVSIELVVSEPMKMVAIDLAQAFEQFVSK